MTSERVTRKLAAILAVDVVGYARLMSTDEAGTLAALIEIRKTVLEPMVTEHRGRIVKLMGDGALIEFGSVVDAVECGVAIQRAALARTLDLPNDKKILLRMGINIGDIIFQNDDIYGDGVNVAARLEALAEPGGICVSGTAFEQVKGKLDAVFEDLGPKQVKNISEPVQVYRVTPATVAPPRNEQPKAPERPSIAVLPFDNLSGDPGQQYISLSMAEDVTTALSRFDWLFVAARNSAFSYQAPSIDVKQVGRELGVRYVLEGSVRNVGDRMRLNVQLVDTETLGHVWADRLDREVDDVLELQDDMVARIASTVAPEIIQAEIVRAQRKQPENFDAWDHYLQAVACYHSMTPDQIELAISHLDDAVRIDPEFAAAYALRGLCEAHAAARGWHRPVKQAYELAHQFAERGIRLSPTSPETNEAYAFVLQVTGRAKESVRVAQRSVELNPYFARGYAVLAHALAFSGDMKGALAACEQGKRSNPRDPRGSWLLDAMGWAYFFLGDYDKAIDVSHRAFFHDPSLFGALVTLACAYARLGQEDEAKRAVDQLLNDIPGFTLRAVRKNPMFVEPKCVENLIDSLRLAGLPE
jgi:TolB-like protein